MSLYASQSFRHPCESPITAAKRLERSSTRDLLNIIQPLQILSTQAEVEIQFSTKDFTEKQIHILCGGDDALICFRTVAEPEEKGPFAVSIATFRDPGAAKQKVLAINRSSANGKTIIAKLRAPSTKEYRASMAIRIKNIPPDVDKKAINQIFKVYGEIICFIQGRAKGQDGTWKCSIVYSSFESASSALASMGGQSIACGTKPIEIAFISLRAGVGSLGEKLCHRRRSTNNRRSSSDTLLSGMQAL